MVIANNLTNILLVIFILFHEDFPLLWAKERVYTKIQSTLQNVVRREIYFLGAFLVEYL